jgi:pyruvate dehydrogenase E1 component
MYEDKEDIFYYITVMNENYPMPEMPGEVKEGIVKGMYKFRTSDKKNSKMKAQLFGSGTIMNEVLKAAAILEEDFKVASDVWSVTSYKQLRRDALEAERWNLLHPNETQKVSYISKMLANEDGVFVASSDYVKTLPDSIAKWFPRPLHSLGTEGFGRSESRAALRDFFEVDAKHIVLAALNGLVKDGKLKSADLDKAMKKLGINPNKKNPMRS